jgi:GTP-binding protein
LKIRSLTVACTTLDPARFPNSPWAEVAVAGRSNVGKSSLLNTLFERKNYARISKDPGKTRTVNFYTVNDRFYLVDLPGYGFARISAETRANWTKVATDYLASRSSLAGVVQLVDARHEPSKADVDMIERLVASRRQFIVVFTKADKIPRAQRSRIVGDFNRVLAGVARIERPGRENAAGGAGIEPGAAVMVPSIFFSAHTGEGKEDLWRWISEQV